MEKRRTIEIPKELMEPDWKTNKVVIKRLTLSENYKIRDDATTLKISEHHQSGSVSQEVAAVSKLVKSVIEAPWEINNNKVAGALDGVLAEMILVEIADFNTLTKKKNTNSKEQSNKK